MCRTFMERNIRLLLLILGVCSRSSCVLQHTYVFIQSPKTWYDAQTYCRQTCSDLATISNMGEMMALLADVEGKYGNALWIGLEKGTVRTWQWSLADDEFYKAGERDYFTWGNSNNFNCAYFDGGKLYMSQCVQPRNSVCFDGKQKVRQQQYVSVATTMTWSNALDNCRTLYTDLVSVRNREESQIIQQVSAGLPVWTGLFRDPWNWSDHSASSFRYWPPSQGIYTNVANVACVALLQSQYGKWGGLSCDEEHPFVCNCPIRLESIKVRISSPDSTLDLNDPAVKDGILKQIEQKLNNNNVNFSQLYWKKNPDGTTFTKN